MEMDIGSKIKELRVVKGLTQEELADRAELSKGFISQVERDLTSPSIATLSDILQCLGVSVAEFFAEDSDDQVVFKDEDYFEKIKKIDVLADELETEITALNGLFPMPRRTLWSRSV